MCPLPSNAPNLELVRSCHRRNPSRGRSSSNGDRVGEVRLLRPARGLHLGVHWQREGRVRRQVALRALRRGRARRARPAAAAELTRRSPGRHHCPHVLLQKIVQLQSGNEGRRRHAADAAAEIRRSVQARVARQVRIQNREDRRLGLPVRFPPFSRLACVYVSRHRVHICSMKSPS